MKSFISALIIGAVIVFGSIAYTSHLEEISKRLLECNSEIETLIRNDRYDSAEQLIKEMSEYIKSKESVLAATGNHEEIDKIEINLAELTEYAAECCKADTLTKIKTLNILFRHLPKNYKLRPENIL